MTVGIRTAALCAAIACVMAAAPSQTAAAAPSSMLRRYPYLTDLVTTNVTINWATTTAGTTGSVGYGRVGVESCTAHTESATKTTITVGSTTEYQWKATLSGLATNSAYCYRVFAGTTDLLGSDPSPVFHIAGARRLERLVLLRGIRRLGLRRLERVQPRPGPADEPGRRERRPVRDQHRGHRLQLRNTDELRRPRADGRRDVGGLRPIVLDRRRHHRSPCSRPRGITA